MYRPSAACDKAALSFHPRIPRYGVVKHDRERLGLTGSVQWAPTDATKISIDGLYSRFRNTSTKQSLITKGARAGQYAIPVYLIQNPRPAPRRVPAWVWGVLAAVLIPAALLALLAWVLAALSAASLALLLGTVLLAFLGWLKAMHARPRGRRTTVTTTVTFD